MPRQSASRVRADASGVRSSGPAAPAPVGAVTRGTTGPDRLRRVERWLAGTQGARLRRAEDPLVVDLGYGASPVTVTDLQRRLRAVRPDVRVVGLEISPERVDLARRRVAGVPGAPEFAVGGFELAVPGGGSPVLVRAFNVLRQYETGEVLATWDLMRSRLAPGGLVVDGTCDELGRRACWVALEREAGPVSLTVSVRLAGLPAPSAVAERLPKVLIHRNVAGEGVHDLLRAADAAWARAAPAGTFGVRQRWVATCRDLARDWPVLGSVARWRLGELTVAWDCVAPRAGGA
ncbi:SAM-dependent methyltransferase [Kineococcus radiotolerans]|uniref:SAM-dependent methyltransferase n=1 Tax=Kineococcus radiotolerans TaxID=131568 RepID=A0A7W4TLD9_KINRA|nr:class I SAM-dependent methyltransferase [Kineococcus radiotolerans]MBB2900431.1 SAM-dependent methyltransferase [Kineococcus radiotolerans]